MIHIFRNICILTIWFTIASPAAQSEELEKTISLAQTIQHVLTRHPDLAVSRIDTAIANTQTRDIKGQLDPQVSASIAAGEDITPVASDFQAAENRFGQFSSTISKPLANGGEISAGFDYSRSYQGFVSPLAAQLAKFNPAYSSQFNIGYRHPLIRGANRPDYHHSITAALATVQSSQLQQQLIAHNLSLQTLNAYYQLASDDINISIAQQAVARAKRLLSYQRTREQFGLIERADRLQAEALLAARKTDLQQALSKRAENQSTLNRLMLQPSEKALRIDIQESATLPPLPSASEAFEQAEENRPELKILQAQLDAAYAQLAIASDADQIQLDVVAEMGSHSLGGKPIIAAVGGPNINNHFVTLSLEFSETFGRNSARASIRKAELERERIVAERSAMIEQIKDELATAMTAVRSGQPTLIAVRKQALAEKKKFKAEMQRYKEGRSETPTLVQFEGELRHAELSAELQLLTLQLARQQLSWAQGSLLFELGLSNLNESE